MESTPKISLSKHCDRIVSKNSGGVCNDINPSNSHLSHQYHDNSQKMPSNGTTVSSKQVIAKNLDITQHNPVECDTSDLDTSVQTQYTTVGNFSREEVVPLYVWTELVYNKMVTNLMIKVIS